MPQKPQEQETKFNGNTDTLVELLGDLKQLHARPDTTKDINAGNAKAKEIANEIQEDTPKELRDDFKRLNLDLITKMELRIRRLEAVFEVEEEVRDIKDALLKVFVERWSTYYGVTVKRLMGEKRAITKKHVTEIRPSIERSEEQEAANQLQEYQDTDTRVVDEMERLRTRTSNLKGEWEALVAQDSGPPPLFSS